jgi:signal transduction histidine kinase
MGNHDAARARARTSAAGDSVTPQQGTRLTRQQLMSLSNWPVSRRLFAVIALALVMGLVFGALQVVSAESSATQFGRESHLAKLGQQDVILTQDLQNERDAAQGLTFGGGTGNLTPLHAAADAEVAKTLALAAGVDGSYPANIQASVAKLRSQLGGLAKLRNTVDTQYWDKTKGSAIEAMSVVSAYAPVINTLITLNDELAQGISDASLAIDVRELNLLSLEKEQVSQQRGLFFNSFTQKFFSDGVLQALISARSAEQSGEAAFLAAATPSVRHAYTTTVAGDGVKSVKDVEDFFFIDGQDEQPADKVFTVNINKSTVGFTPDQAPAAWYQASTQKLDQMQAVESQIAQDIVGRAASLQHGASQSALIVSVIVVAVLLIVLLAALAVARSLALPLRRLRAGALDVATVQLPDRMRRLSETADAPLEIAPIDVLSVDEIGQVARAFDQVHAEAVRLAGNEAMLRTSFNAMFVNLSRRSQTLIERLARTIDSLEQNEDDPERLSSLFSMDHMVTRMRRNSENLLLLAGHEGARKWSDPVSLADVARAAVSEIEHYARVVLSVQPGIAVVGPAVSDVVHLLAELIENATLFSPTDTAVQVSGAELSSGGVLIDVSDQGIGIPEDRLAEMNWRLRSTPQVDVTVSRHMGLFAVARLAERHGIQVRLRPASPQGLSALVWLPDAVVQRTARQFGGGRTPLAAQAAGSLQVRRSPGQSLPSRPVADGQQGSGFGDARGSLASAGQPAAGQPSVDWFRNPRESVTGGSQAERTEL